MSNPRRADWVPGRKLTDNEVRLLTGLGLAITD